MKFLDRSEEKRIYSYLNYRRKEEKTNFLLQNYQRNEDIPEYLFLNHQRNEEKLIFISKLSKEQRKTNFICS
jgi:hypothetical protein